MVEEVMVELVVEEVSLLVVLVEVEVVTVRWWRR